MSCTQRLVELGFALSCLLLSGCVVSQNVPVEIDEDNVFLGSLSVLLPLENEESLFALREGRVNDAYGTMISIELEGTYFSDDADQTLTGGETLRIDDVEFNGPGIVAYTYDVNSVTGYGRYGFVLGGGFVFDGLFGLSYHNVDLAGDFAGLNDGTTIESLGMLLGGQLSYFTPIRIEILAKAWQSSELDNVDVTNIEVGLAYHFHRRGSIELGYRWWDYTATSESIDSDVEIKSAGPQISLNLVW